MNNLFRLSLVVSLLLGACTTTYDAKKSNSPSLNDTPVQSSDAERAGIRLQLGISYLQQDQLATALKELNSAISLNPNLVDAYGVRALVYFQMHDNKLAEQDFLKTTRLAPNNSDHLNNYAWFLCMDGREKQAMEMFDRVLKDRTYTQPVKALNNAGLCSLKLKDDEAAEHFFTQSLHFDSNNPTTNLNLARINYKKQNWERARFYIDRNIKSDALTPEIVWLAIKINHKLKDQMAKSSLSIQLQRRFADSAEYDLLQRGAFDE